jgi:hypothetical protein
MWLALRIAGAFGVTAFSFWLFWHDYHDYCLFPSNGDLYSCLFYILPIVFMLGFIWLVSEAVHPLLLAAGLRRHLPWLVAIVTAATVYAAVGFLGHVTTSTMPRYHGYSYDDFDRRYVWVFWVIGVQMKTGSDFGVEKCGY